MSPVQTFNLKEKVILVTGGYGYLGRSVCESLLYHGATVYVLGKSSEKYSHTFKDLNSETLNLAKCDVSKSEQIKSTLKNIYEKEKRIDVLINNAFYCEGNSPDNMSDLQWEKSMDGVLGSVFKCIREITPFFKKNKKGSIINVSSMYGMVSPDFKIYENFPEYLNPPHYGAAKAGVLQLTRYYANYLGKYNINVNSITPGAFPRPTSPEKFIKELKAKTCLNRVGCPEDLAGAFVFLSSKASSYMTGQNIIIDGGWTSQ
jgi:NAD(P)-dependent dehydrogenase (short-subunit alcohol dehydrogenase family)